MDLHIKKFIQITSLIFILFVLFIIGLLGIYNQVSIEFYQLLFMIIILLLIAATVSFALGVMVLTKIYKTKKMFIMKPKQILSLIRTTYPLMNWVLSTFKISKQPIIRFFVEINNISVVSMKLKLSPLDILVLTPHCLQKSSCPIKVTIDSSLCKRCGDCGVHHLLELKDKYGVHIAIASGGTLARKVIKDYTPKLIIAVACERDLISGIMDVHSIPVLGVLNQRPNGPCFNTIVDIKVIESSIIQFI